MASGYYVNKVAANCRSSMNIPFFLPRPAQPTPSWRGAKARGCFSSKATKMRRRHPRAIYNAMDLAGVQALWTT